jgi:shikimate dehydrogenase
VRFAVVGDPVDHSLSPRIHTAGYEALGLPHTYEGIRVPLGGFHDVAERLVDGDLDGVNVTMPHKDAAHGASDELSHGAQRSRAVNTIIVDHGKLVGHNTDIDGVAFAVGLLGLPADARIIILGTGGAARAAMVALEGRSITVVARSRKRALGAIAATSVEAKAVAWDARVAPGILVNATPIGMRVQDAPLPSSALDPAIGLLDMAYGHGATRAEGTLRERGLPVSDGIAMLVGQGAAAFELFTGTEAPVEAMMHEARRSAS